MNLVQIQERLKDMPLQAVMQYANGMNPEVPPYLALGELNRRKKMEQAMQPAEMPQGTVKEQLEQEVGLAALQKQLMNQLQTQGLRQQQAAMSQGRQMANMPGPAPQGVPQPEVPEEMEMADGGVATLRVPDDQFEFGSGGIIAFGGGGSAENRRYKKLQEERAGLRPRYEENITSPSEIEDVVPPVLTTEPEGKPPSPPPPPPPPAAAPAPARQSVAQTAPPQGIATVAPQAVAYPEAGPMQQALAAMAMGPQTPYPSYDEERRKAEERNPYLKKQPGEKLEQYLATLERRDREDQERFQEMEKERTRGALWKSLMSAGEASRGQRGIGALLGGFGRTSETEMEAGRGREEKQRALMREREMNRVKMSQEIESARIAAAQGQEKERMEHLQKAAQFNQRDKELAIQMGIAQASTEAAQQRSMFEVNAANARSFAQLQAQAAEGKLDRENRVLVANIQAASGNRPGEAERIFEEYQRRWKADPSGKLAQEYMDNIQKIKGTYTRGENTRISGLTREAEEIRKVLADPVLINKLPKDEVERLRKRLPEVISQIGMAEPGAKKEAGKIYLD
jgi:hypothetical protein